MKRNSQSKITRALDAKVSNPEHKLMNVITVSISFMEKAKLLDNYIKKNEVRIFVLDLEIRNN